MLGDMPSSLLRGELLFSVTLTDQGRTRVSESLDHAFLMLPGHCLGMALFNLYYNYGLQKLCETRNLSQSKCNKFCEYRKWRSALLQDTSRRVWAYSQGCTRITTIPVREHFHLTKKKRPPFTLLPHSLLPIAPGSHKIYFLSLWICLLWTFHINGIT